jgi:succinoglycan biosynthesis protein ExoA
VTDMSTPRPAAALPPLDPLDPRSGVSVVIPARGAAALLPACLAAILPQLGPDDEVIVAAADPASAAAARAAGDARVLVVDNPAGTTPAALNRAIGAARHPVVLRFDPQARLPQGYRDRVVALLARTGAVNVGGRQVPQASDGFAAAVAVAMSSPLGHGGAAYRSTAQGGPVDTVYLGTFRADALAAVGGFDERFLTNQDAELNERLRRAGGTVWLDPDLAVAYRPRGSVPALARQFRSYGRGRAMTARQHPGSLRARQIAPTLLLLSLLVVSLALPLTTVLLVVWLGGYGALLLLGALLGVLAAEPRRIRRVPGVMLALGTMHLAWGLGFVVEWLRPRPTRRRTA